MRVRDEASGDRTPPETPISKRSPRYLVVDRDAPDGDLFLPDGGRGKVVARFSSPAKAVAMATSAPSDGHRLAVVDSFWIEAAEPTLPLATHREHDR